LRAIRPQAASYNSDSALGITVGARLRAIRPQAANVQDILVPRRTGCPGAAIVQGRTGAAQDRMSGSGLLRLDQLTKRAQGMG